MGVTINGLPPESQQWRRDIESQLSRLSTVSSNLNTLVLGMGSQLGVATAARRVADGKITFSSIPPTNPNPSDLWIDSGNDNRFNVRLNDEWTTAPISADTVKAGAVDGITITGALIRTAGSGERLELIGNSWKGYDSEDFTSIEFSPDRITFWSVAETHREAEFTRYGLSFNEFGGGSVWLEADYRVGLNISDGEDSGVNVRYDQVFLTSASGSILFKSDTNGIQADNAIIGTTTSPANATWVAGGVGDYEYVLRRSTSLRKYKVAYEDADDHDLLDFRPRKWFDRDQVENAGLDPETATAEQCLNAGLRWTLGFIAEEVEEADDSFALYNGGRLEGVAYDRFEVAAYGTMKKFDERLKVLESGRAD